MREYLDYTFGMSEPPEARSFTAIGPLSFYQSETATRTIAWRGVEVVRAVDYPIRDRDWGTFPTRTLAFGQYSEANVFRLNRDFETLDGSVTGRFELSASAEGALVVSLRLATNVDTELCRTGFTILHPIAGLAGELADLKRSNGEAFQAKFPKSIAPGQPVTDFVGLRYRIAGVSVAIEMKNGVFEMEDQRNWSDASYKTYVKTASFPGPYRVTKGDIFEQTMTMAFSGAGGHSSIGATPPVLRFEPKLQASSFPEIAVAIEPSWGPAAAPPLLTSLRRVARFDLRRPLNFDILGFTRSSSPAALDLELVLSDDRRGAEKEIETFTAALAKYGAAPGHVIAQPAAYLKSYQPSGPWPSGLTPSDAITLARQAFPAARIGGGALTNFTEFNRCRPDIEQIHYVTHGSSAIVHAADDTSVFQTLEALPDIFCSATEIAAGKAYRLGLVSIGMRENPYGSGLASNKERQRRTTCAFDPRVRGLFGAAWLVGVAAATEFAGIELLTLATLGGPFAIADANELMPAYHVLAWLARMQGRPRRRMAPKARPLHAVAVESERGLAVVVANGSSASMTISCAGKGRAAILDGHSVAAACESPVWTKNAAADFEGTLSFGPYAVAFLDLTLLDGE